MSEEHALVSSMESVKMKVYLDNCCDNRPFDTQNINTVIFISAAIIAECDFFVTTDKKLLNYKSDRIAVINPIDFIRLWESKNA
jgi:predicted nucleic acid-binding protein